jgi:UDP-N-acetylglucosamine 2-epimerase
MCEDCEALEEEAEFYAQEAAKWKRMYVLVHRRETALAQRLRVLLQSLRQVAREVRGMGRN